MVLFYLHLHLISGSSVLFDYKKINEHFTTIL